MCNIVIVFLTGLWGPGTREIDFNFSKIPFEYNDYVTRSVKSHGTEKLYSFISDVEYGDKFVGLEYFNRKHQLSFYIPACYESFRTISTWNKKIISTTNDLFYFVDKTNVIYILASKYATEQPENALSAAAFNTLQDNGTFTRVYDDDEFFILKRR